MRVYLLKNRVNGKCYVGQTVQLLRSRLAQHRAAASRTERRSAIHEAINKHGWDAFEVEVLEECDSPGDLNMAERFWIGCYNSLAPNGYNLEAGGCDTTFVSEETREKVRAAAKGRVKTKDHRRNLSLAQVGRVQSLETRMKIGAARAGRPHSPEHAQKIRETLRAKGKLSMEAAREIRKLAAAGSTPSELATRFGVSSTNIRHVIAGKSWVDHRPLDHTCAHAHNSGMTHQTGDVPT